jgi:hypothetical protein
MLLASPIGSAARRLLLLPCAHTRHEDDVLHARLHGRIDGGNVLCTAFSGLRSDGRDDEQTIKTCIGLRKAFGPVVVPQACFSLSGRSFGCARNRHYFVALGSPEQFRDDSSAQMAAGAADTDFHINLQLPDGFSALCIAKRDTCMASYSRGGYLFSKGGILRCEPSPFEMGETLNA